MPPATLRCSSSFVVQIPWEFALRTLLRDLLWGEIGKSIGSKPCSSRAMQSRVFVTMSR